MHFIHKVNHMTCDLIMTLEIAFELCFACAPFALVAIALPFLMPFGYSWHIPITFEILGQSRHMASILISWVNKKSEIWCNDSSSTASRLRSSPQLVDSNLLLSPIVRSSSRLLQYNPFIILYWICNIKELSRMTCKHTFFRPHRFSSSYYLSEIQTGLLKVSIRTSNPWTLSIWLATENRRISQLYHLIAHIT